jgi:hypothetical protein
MSYCDQLKLFSYGYFCGAGNHTQGLEHSGSQPLGHLLSPTILCHTMGPCLCSVVQGSCELPQFQRSPLTVIGYSVFMSVFLFLVLILTQGLAV